MNVLKCSNGQKGNLHCVFKMRRLDEETGKPVDCGCVRHKVKDPGDRGNLAGKDFYNIYPEHDIDTGDAIYQQDSSQPSCFRVGPMLIWENINNSGINGLSFEHRSFAADIHPLYRKEERNLPTHHTMSEDDIGEIFGGVNPVLVTTGWNAERWFGIDNVETCNDVIYGTFNKISDMTIPKAFKSYSRDIPGWQNYTTKIEWYKPKGMSLENMSVEEINSFCKTTFQGSTIEHMKEALLYIKDGNFLNIWTLMGNNFVSNDIKRKVMDTISLRSKKDLYSGKINLKLYSELYTFIDQMRDKNQKYLPFELKRMFKSNLLNFVLNYPSLQSSNDIIGKCATNQRYWFVIQMMKKARRDKILDMTKPLPKWLVSLLKEKNDPTFIHLGEKFKYSTAPKDIQCEYDEATIMKLASPKELYPGMLDIKTLLGVKGYDSMWCQFSDILDSGRHWNMAEIRLAWDHFQPAWANNDPSMFWDWVEIMADLPYETNISVSQEEYADQIKKVNGKSLDLPEEEKVLEFGACDFNLGDGYVSSGRMFALNLAQQVLDNSSWEVQKIPHNNAYDAIARVTHVRECNHETFWTTLAKANIFKEDRINIKSVLSESTLEEIMENHIQGVATLDGINEVGLADSDLDNLEMYDSLTGQSSDLNRGGDTWSEED